MLILSKINSPSIILVRPDAHLVPIAEDQVSRTLECICLSILAYVEPVSVLLISDPSSQVTRAHRIDSLIVDTDLTGFAEDRADWTGLSSNVLTIFANVEFVRIGIVGYEWLPIASARTLTGLVDRLCLVHYQRNHQRIINF